MAVNLDCGSTGHGGNDPSPIMVQPDYLTKEVIAHEFGHKLVYYNMEEVASSNTINEHISDMQGMAISTQWKVAMADGCPIRDWKQPSSVTQTCDSETVYYPDTFDEYNVHSYGGAGTKANHYAKWHVPSTLWSHLVYRLSQKPSVGRQMATEQVYLTLRKYLEYPNDLSFSGYAHWLRVQADDWGTPIDDQMRNVQKEIKLWKPSEALLSNCYTRPGIVGVGYWNWFWYVDELHVYYNEYIPGVSDKLMGTDQIGAYIFTG